MSSSEEEEEILLHVEFNGMLENNLLQNLAVCKVIGLDSKQPVMQIGNQTFTGEYMDTVGTALFFEDDNCPPGGDPVFSKPAEHELRYLCKTRKSLHMSRVFLKKKFKQEQPGYPTSDESDQEQGEPITATQDSASASASTSNSNSKPQTTTEIYEPVAGPSWAPDVPYVMTIPPFES